MPDSISKAEAHKLVNLDPKTFQNYFQVAEEFHPLPRVGRGRFQFDKGALLEWKKGYDWRTVELGLSDYRMCLDFALAQHFRGYVLSDFGSGRQREFGQKITNWVKGQLGEIAVKKFFKEKFSTEVELDFSIYDEIVPQDIIGVIEKGKPRRVNAKIGIKTSKPKSAYLVLGENEIRLEARRSDYYIFCRANLPDDHLLRITHEKIVEEVREQQHFKAYEHLIPKFGPIPCEVAGYCHYSDLEKVTKIPGQDFTGERYVIKTGKMKKSLEEWKGLLEKL